MTVEVQPDPRHYLSQGWLYGFSDGRGGYPLDWTVLKAWGSDRPEPERFPGSGGKGYDWPATGWHEFRDPNEEWELTFYRYNSNVVRQVNQNIDNARQSKAFEQWNQNWVKFVERNVGAWMHVDHGLGLYLFANANRRAPTNMHNNAISVNSMHRIRAGPGPGAVQPDPDRGDPELRRAKRTWRRGTPTRQWQGVRETAEQLTAIDDWCEAIFAANVVFEPLVGELFRSQLVQHAAPRNGDFVTPDDRWCGRVRLRRARPALHAGHVRAAHHRQANSPTTTSSSCTSGWSIWTARSIAAARALQPIWSQPDSKPPRFEDGLDAVKNRFAALLSELHLDVPKELGQ